MKLTTGVFTAAMHEIITTTSSPRGDHHEQGTLQALKTHFSDVPPEEVEKMYYERLGEFERMGYLTWDKGHTFRLTDKWFVGTGL